MRCLYQLASLVFPVLLGASAGCGAQTPAAPVQFDPVPAFSFGDDALTIRQPALPSHPFTVTGRHGVILGLQDGEVELWKFPVKLFGELQVRAEIEGYSTPIELNPLAAEIEVSPDHTTLVYAHPAITVRQHMFAPAGEGNDGIGAMVVFEIESIHPVTLTISLTPAMQREWPAPQWGQPGWDWRPLGSGGAYVLGTDNPGLFGMIGMPRATPAAVSAYQERPHAMPLAFHVHFDPARDGHRLFPLICDVNRPGERNDAAGVAALQARMLAVAADLPAMYARSQAYYAHFFDQRTVVHTPDARFDAAIRWAELAIDKEQATTSEGETGLVAGWYPSFGSARPGFGWFFGRDTLWSMYAIDSYGDEALARRAFEFLIRRQRADGKMMHEFSQTASMLTGDMVWDKLPYEYAAADATPLFLLAMEDYVRATGDVAFLRTHWDAVQLAYHFERTHDSDGDGVYDNSQGTGWVESWPPQMPHQELYLAALDRDATQALAQLARWAGHPDVGTEATATAAKLAVSVKAYGLPNGLVAFSKNADGTYDATQTVYPSVGLWSSGQGLPNASNLLQAWASHVFSTDWGTRAVAETDPVYDPISYHQGSVWPLFTGWISMAQYRGGQSLAGYQALRRDLDLTWAQDPGSVTEVLSGRFYEPLGRSTTHQLWSSAMVLAPALRELFGVEPDAPEHALYLHPHLPPEWDHVSLEHVRAGDLELEIKEQRMGAHLVVTATSEKPSVLCLRAEEAVPATSLDCHEAPATVHRIELPLPPVEINLPASPLPTPGSDTAQPRVLEEKHEARSAEVTVEALAGSTVALALRRNGQSAKAPHSSDGALTGDQLVVHLPAGEGYVQKRVTVSW